MSAANVIQLRNGLRLRSAVCATELVVVRAPAAPIDLRCGGTPMAEAGGDVATGVVDPAFAEGTLLGKRYADEVLGLEVLCTKAGDGSLSIGNGPLAIKSAKPLPASD